MATEILSQTNHNPVEVPLVFNDLKQNLTLEDTLHALTQLQEAFDHTMYRLESRVADEKARLTNINARTAVCLGKVNSVRGSNKATTVFSTAKFPGPKKCNPSPSTFVDPEEFPSPFPEPDDDTHYSIPQPELSSVGNRAQSQELFDMYQSLNQHGTDMIRAEFIMEDKGLGNLPAGLPSVGSCLLFNSHTNPYSNYQTLDNLMSTGRERAEDTVTKDGIHAAPSTLVSGEVLPDINALDLTYRPQMGEMASLALPSNLPLDFLADIQYDGTALPSIAPSSHRAAVDMNLPQITDGTNNRTYSAPPSAKEVRPVNTPAATTTAPPPPPPSSSAPPPPPSTNTAPPPPPDPVNTAPPPPVDIPKSSMPPPLENPMAGLKPPAERTEDEAPPARMGLLDAIKGMNVNKLRSKEEANVKAAKVQVKEEVKKPLSMMDEMRARMQRRNSAISGKQGRRESMRDGELVKAAQQATSGLPPKPTSSNSIIFGSVDEENEDGDDSSERSSDVSVSSGDSFGSEKKVVVPFTPPVVKPPTPAVVQPPVPQEKRGSLLESEKATNLLITAKIREEDNDVSDSESDDDDWD